MLRIGKKLGDNMSGLALVATPSLLKYHSGASEELEMGDCFHNTAFIWNWRTHWRHSWSRECGNSVPIQRERVDDLLQLIQSFQCKTRRFTERLDNKSISGGPPPNEEKNSPSVPPIETLGTDALGHHKGYASRCSCGVHVTAVDKG